MDPLPEITAFLADCRTASLATVDALGTPHAANVQYASNEAHQLIWVSSESTAHSVNLAANPKAAVTVYAHDDRPENIHGLQLQGTAMPAPDREQALATYTQRYPFVAEPPYVHALAKQTLYIFTPTWLRWIDNRRGFGWKVEMALK